jgi:DNA polymerase elongation subunit (family B)
MFKEPRILVFDIETAPMVAYVWGRRDINVALNQIKREWSIIAWSAKWLGDPPSKVMYRDARHSKHIENDREILLPLWKLLDEADIVITQNGQSFDSPKLNARFIMHGMKPPSPYRHLDTYRIVRRVAGFTSNKLEYLTEKLCTKYRKIKHVKFPGQSLWTECLAGNIKAWNAMKEYNIHDVLSTEELYMKLRAWVTNSMPHAHLVLGKMMKCTSCGSFQLRRKGSEMTKKGPMQKYQCQSCGKWSQGEKI